MIVDSKREFMFVCVAKTASTSIRRRFGYFQDPPPEEYHMFLEDGLERYPFAKDYFKFAFVRNPYTRLFSIYNNLKYDGHVWASALKKKNTFEDFIMDLEGSEYSKYIHLQPQFHYVKKDNDIGVDFLGKYESLNQHFLQIQTILKQPSNPLERHRESSRSSQKPLYTENMKLVVQRVYWEDFERFEYEK